MNKSNPVRLAAAGLAAVYDTLFVMFSQLGKLWPPALGMETTFGWGIVSMVDAPFVAYMVNTVAAKLGVFVPDRGSLVIGAFLLLCVPNALIFARSGAADAAKKRFRSRPPLVKVVLICAAFTVVGASIAVALPTG